MGRQEKQQPIQPHEQHFGVDGLNRLRNATTEEALREVLFDVARDYAPNLGLDFDHDILPNLEDKAWWDADYGVSQVDGREIGMSAKDAFRCLVDVHRTFQLAQGIKETVVHIKQNKTEPIRAIDAGTGTSILSLLLAAHGVDHVTAIEFNTETFGYTQTFLKQAGLDDRITIIEGDATQVPLEDFATDRADILVSENLSGGLMEEPQYDIIAHLSQYLTPDVKIIPYNATLSVSVGHADWGGVPAERRAISVRRLNSYEQLSDNVPYAQVESKVGMEVPIIEGSAVIPLRRHGTVNALVISTDFQINEVGNPVYLSPDTAEFLGKSRAFRINGEIVDPQTVDAQLRYRTGRSSNVMDVTTNKNAIRLNDGNLTDLSPQSSENPS